MQMRSLLRSRLCLPIGGLAVLVVYLLYGPVARSGQDSDRVIWVYYTSLCVNPGDTSDCTEVKQTNRRAFDSQEACSAYRDIDLSHHRDPHLMGSCLRQHEV